MRGSRGGRGSGPSKITKLLDLFSNTRLDPLENLKGKPEFNVGPLISAASETPLKLADDDTP